MQRVTSPHAVHPLDFGRGPMWLLNAVEEKVPAQWVKDAKTFATFFAAGFVFMSVYLA